MNHKKKLNLLVVGCLLVTLIAAVFTVGCPTPQETTTPPPETTAPPTETTTPPPAEEHLTVGAIIPISGPMSTVGMAWVRGYELYFDKLNAEGGVQIGDTIYFIDFVAGDDKMNPEEAGTAAQKLVFQDGATFVFGAIMEQCTQAVYDVCAPNGVLHLIPWISNSPHPADISPGKPLCIRPMISAQDSNVPLIDYMVETYPDAKTIAILSPNYGLTTMSDLFAAAAEERGLEVVATATWDWGTTDYIPYFTSLLASEPDAVCGLNAAQAHYQLMAARQLGFTGPFISTSPLGPDVFLVVAGAEVSSDVICSGWDPAIAEGELKEIVDNWNAAYGPEPFISDAAFAWEEASILVQAMETAQSVDPEAVMVTLESMTAPGSIQSPFGPARMAGIETYGANRVLERPIPVSHIVDGQINFIGFIPVEVK